MGITIEEEYKKYHDAYMGMFDRVMAFKTDVERREKSIEASVEYAWHEIGKKDANNAILEHYSKDIHDYAVILNELANVKRELQKILEGE